MDKIIFQWFYNVIQKLPDINFEPPAEIYYGITQMTRLLGWLMPFDLYQPLLTFILAFTGFQITYALYLRFKK